MASFDPYLVWLGIRPEDQPPDHYRLLGIKPYEPKPEVIVRAAKRQMARVKNAQSGEVSQLAQDILKEIALARNCLLDPVKRAEHDRQLKTRLEQQAGPTRPSRSANPPGPEQIRSSGPVGIMATNGQESSSGIRRAERSPLSRLMSIVLGGIAGTLLAVAILYAVHSRDAAVARRESPPPAGSQPVVAPTPLGPDRAPQEPSQPEARARTPEAEPEASAQTPESPAVSPTPESLSCPETDALPDDTPIRREDDETSTPGLQDAQVAGDTQDKRAAASSPAAEQPPAEVTPQPKKPAVPDEASQQEAEQRVRELLKAEFDAAGTPEEQHALAERLVKLGRETTGDPNTRFVLFRLAYELTAATGDWARALSVVATMGEYYEADVLSTKADVLGAVVERLQVTPQTADSVEQVFKAVSEGLDGAVAADNYNAANRFLRSARVMARKMGNPALTRELGVREREIGRMQRAFDRVKNSLDSVARGSADAAANLEAGRWYCYEKGNWEKGLPLLSKGSNAPLADLARRDLANPADYRQQIQLAEHWLQAAKNEPSSTASHIVSRAQHWCDQAMPKLDEAVANDDYDTAGRLLSVAVSAARDADDRELVVELTSRQKEIGRLEQRFAAVTGSLETLASDPDNRDANLAAGQWYCFDKGHWEKGLPLLAKGADSELANLARRDAADPSTPSEQLKLADDWWKRAETDRRSKKSAIQSRAQYWYEQALPKLTGLDKVRVQRLLEDATARTDVSRDAQKGGVIEKGNVALAINGSAVTGEITHGHKLIDGNAADVRHGYVYAEYPCEWTITFPKTYVLREMRLLLYDLDERYHHYAVAISADGEKFTLLGGSGQTEARGWQTIQFSPRTVKAVRLLGLYSSGSRSFIAVEFEAYCVPPGPPPANGTLIRF